MCVMLIKRDKNMASYRTKSRISVLGNLDGCLWEKSKKYAPVLQYSSLRLLTSVATENCHVLEQGDCKNTFCNACLPNDKTTITQPSSGDPDTKKGVVWLLRKTLYGLSRSPCH